MDGLPLELPIFLLATFAGALVAGLSGFAFGLVAASIWLYILSALAERRVDRGIRFYCARLLGLEAAARTRFEQALALHHRCGNRCTFGRDGAETGQSCIRAHGRGSVPRSLQSLCILSACAKADQSGGATVDASVGFLNGVLGGMTGLAGILSRYGVAYADGQGPATHSFPAGRGRSLFHERALARSERCHHAGHD